MTTPDVLITQLDGALGIQPPSGSKMLAICGPADSGPIATPAAFARIVDITGTFGGGPTVEAAAFEIEHFGKPVIFIRTNATTLGSFGTIVTTGVTGTSVVAVDATTHPNDDYEVAVRIVAGGVRGTAGITYQESLDGGRTWSAVKALGVATSIIVAGSGGVAFTLAAGTLVANDTWSVRGNAPLWSAADLAAALDALKASNMPWEACLVVGPIDATALSTIDGKAAAMAALGKYRYFIGNTRMPNPGETEAAYKTALDGIFGGLSSKSISLWAGAAKVVSSVNYRKYRRPVAMPVAAMLANVSPEINIAQLDVGHLDGVEIRDSNGNPDEHDETINPGLDDSRFGTLRTWEGEAGVFANWPRIFASAGSDFQLVPFRRVMNIFCETLRGYMIRRIAKPIRVDKVTGYILEADALEIEAGAGAILRAVIMQKPMASKVAFVLSRTDNLLSTQTLTGDGRLTPLGYPKFINLSLGFNNPALRVVAV